MLLLESTPAFQPFNTYTETDSPVGIEDSEFLDLGDFGTAPVVLEFGDNPEERVQELTQLGIFDESGLT
jgi:hypothetical protein